MIDPEQALQTVSRITRRPRRELQLTLTLGELGLSSSLGLSTLRSALQRQFQVELPPLQWSMTLAELLGGAPSPTPSSSILPRPPAGNWQVVGLGVDLEEVESLRSLLAEGVQDQHFSPSELARAGTHPQPEQHLCGIFCAKEALKKSHPALLDLPLLAIEIGHDEAGRPRIEALGEGLLKRFQFQLSISHTPHYATATVIVLGRQP